jgi:preprotein translocase subunit SecB
MKFQVKEISLLSSTFELDRSFSGPGEECDVPVSISFDANVNQEKGEITGFLRVQTSPENKDTAPYSADFEFGGKFLVKEPETVSEEEVDRFCGVNAPAIIFPFAREYLADLVRRSGLKSTPLPPVNFVEAYQQQKDANKSDGDAGASQS